MKVIKTTLDYKDQKTNALVFLPEMENGFDESALKPTFALLTHGYTADKSSILNWPIRLSEAGIAAIVFDLPGHYLGNYSEVEDFAHFKLHGHELFVDAFNTLKECFLEEYPGHSKMLATDTLKIVFAGHSLGAMLSLKAMGLPSFSEYKKISIAVGLGMAPKNVVHLFDTPFYKATLRIREQLVSKALKSDNVFPWIKEEKEHFDLHEQTIHLITGVDDLVVGEDGMERFAAVLSAKDNKVTFEKPSKLPHHEPQLAAGYVKKHLKKIGWL